MIALIEMEKSELPFTIWPSTLVDYAQGSTLLTVFSFVQQLFVSDYCWWALYGPLVIGSMKRIGIPPWSPSHKCSITRGQLHHNVISLFAMRTTHTVSVLMNSWNSESEGRVFWSSPNFLDSELSDQNEGRAWNTLGDAKPSGGDRRYCQPDYLH